jgi:hypothetical protein
LASRPSYLAQSFVRTETCKGRVGRGFINIANGPDDFEKMECDDVWDRARRRKQLTYDFPHYSFRRRVLVVMFVLYSACVRLHTLALNV